MLLTVPVSVSMHTYETFLSLQGIKMSFDSLQLCPQLLMITCFLEPFCTVKKGSILLFH